MQPRFESNSTAAAIFWVVFFGWGSLEWGGTVAEARRLRRSGIGRSPSDKGTPGLFFLAIYGGFALAFLAAYGATWAAIGGPRWLSFGVGIALTVAGIAVRQWAIQTLGPLFTREVRIQDGHRVVTAGPYRLVRHPSYAAGLMSDAGFGLALGNWLSLAAAVVPILVVMIRRIRVEEEALRDGLGEGVYDQYAAGRARLIPGVWWGSAVRSANRLSRSTAEPKPRQALGIGSAVRLDNRTARVHTRGVGGVERLPRRDHFTDERGHGLRTTWHPDQGLVILSIWDGERCVGTFRLVHADVPRLANFLVEAVGDAAGRSDPSSSVEGDAAVNGD